jgi:hypothetical protein
MAGTVKRRAIEELQGEIELKENVVKAYQQMFAKSLKDGMGEEMKKSLPKPPQKTKQNFWTKLKENFIKILS